ncbi:MAG: helix-turn-helix domain-containing protein [Gammaproteobacteria bacterium]|jgi:DNA-binding HxlR family transcriptional regulator/putative sterol carrier protein
MYDYGEACPVSRASSILCERWTLQIIREMLLGATKFSEFQKYLPKISPSLLNARLKMLADHEIIVRKRVPEKRGFEYQLAPAGKALGPVVMAIGKWGMQWVYDGLTEERMNMVVLLREIAVFLKTENLPAGDTVIQFTFTDLEEGQRQYIVVHEEKREVCDENPGHEVDVYLRSTLRTLSEIWWGDTGLLAACEDGRLKVGGSVAHTKRLKKWFPVSSFARDNPRWREDAASD